MRQLFIDSRDRISGTTTDFTIQLPQTLSLQAGRRGRIDNLRVPLVIPTIQAGSNDTLQIVVGATTYTITLPQANYDGPGLASAIQGLLASSVPGGWVVTYDTSNIAMSISCTNPFTIVGGTYAAQLQFAPIHSDLELLRLLVRLGARHRYDVPEFAQFRDHGHNRASREPRHSHGSCSHNALWQCLAG